MEKVRSSELALSSRRFLSFSSEQGTKLAQTYKTRKTKVSLKLVTFTNQRGHPTNADVGYRLSTNSHTHTLTNLQTHELAFNLYPLHSVHVLETT